VILNGLPRAYLGFYFTPPPPEMSYSYNAKKLPPGFSCDCAIAQPEGYNGHAVILNIARDASGQAWAMAEHGRFPMDDQCVRRRMISDKPLKNAPFVFDPNP